MPEMKKEAVIFETLPTKVNNAWILDGISQLQMIKKGCAFTFGELADINLNMSRGMRFPTIKYFDRCRIR